MSRLVILAVIAFTLTTGAALAVGDADHGKTVFRKCQACHKIGDGATNGVGPMLTGVVGRKAGTIEGYTYSQLNQDASTQGLVWTEDTLKDYLPDATAYLKKFLTAKGKTDLATGSSKMPFKLADPGDIADVIAFLKTFSK